MHRILTIFFTLFSTFVFAQQTTVDTISNDIILKNFISQLADPNIAPDVILSQHVIIEEPTNDLYDYLEVSLEEIRINLLSKKLEDIQYIPFTKMSKKDINDIDLGELPPEDVYFLYYQKRQVLAIYIENGKIGSFTLVPQGNGKANFVLY